MLDGADPSLGATLLLGVGSPDVGVMCTSTIPVESMEGGVAAEVTSGAAEAAVVEEAVPEVATHRDW